MPYYEEVKWCKKCKRYVRYLLSLQGSYCVHCGSEVSLFNRKDMKTFRKALRT